jgi:hypothetical protein
MINLRTKLLSLLLMALYACSGDNSNDNPSTGNVDKDKCARDMAVDKSNTPSKIMSECGITMADVWNNLPDDFKFGKCAAGDINPASTLAQIENDCEVKSSSSSKDESSSSLSSSSEYAASSSSENGDSSSSDDGSSSSNYASSSSSNGSVSSSSNGNSSSSGAPVVKSDPDIVYSMSIVGLSSLTRSDLGLSMSQKNFDIRESATDSSKLEKYKKAAQNRGAQIVGSQGTAGKISWHIGNNPAASTGFFSDAKSEKYSVNPVNFAETKINCARDGLFNATIQDVQLHRYFVVEYDLMNDVAVEALAASFKNIGEAEFIRRIDSLSAAFPVAPNSERVGENPYFIDVLANGSWLKNTMDVYEVFIGRSAGMISDMRFMMCSDEFPELCSSLAAAKGLIGQSVAIDLCQYSDNAFTYDEYSLAPAIPHSVVKKLSGGMLNGLPLVRSNYK